MPESIARRIRAGRPARWTAALGISVAWLMVVTLAVAKLRQTDGVIVAFAGLAASVITFGLLTWTDRVRWRNPIGDTIATLRNLRQNPGTRPLASAELEPELAELTLEIAALAKLLRSRAFTRRIAAPPAAASSGNPQPTPSQASLTRSGLFDAPPAGEASPEPNTDPAMSGDYSTADMVNRLDPVHFRWIDSSTAEQILRSEERRVGKECLE